VEQDKVKLEALKEQVLQLQQKSVAEREKAERLAQGQRDALEKDMKEKMALAKLEVHTQKKLIFAGDNA
jgi:hypothetical protein